MAALFQKCAEHVSKIVGEKTLHPVEDLNTSERFKTLCIVEKRKRFWSWKKSSLHPTFATINDLVWNDITLSNDKKSFTLLKSFQDEPSLDVSGSLSTKILNDTNIDLKANEKLRLKLKLGDIEKNEISWVHLSQVLKENPVRREHPLYTRATQNEDVSYCVVIASIATKGVGDISQETDEGVSIDAKENLTVVDCEVHGKASLEKKTAFSFSVPPNTVLAYSCVEFSISPLDSLISLHTTYDTFDEVDGNAMSSVQSETVKTPLETTKHELHHMKKFKKFKKLKDSFVKVLYTGTNEIINLLHLLFQRTIKYSENQTKSDNFILTAEFQHLTKTEDETAWRDILSILGFSVPDSFTTEQSFITLSTNEDALVKSCLGLVDSMMDLTSKARDTLSKISPNHKKTILNIIESCLEDESNFLHILSDDHVREDSFVVTFLNECGFVMGSDARTVAMPEYNTDLLLDAYIVIYTLFDD